MTFVTSGIVKGILQGVSKRSPAFYTFLSTWIEFGTEYVEKINLQNYKLRQNRSSEAMIYLWAPTKLSSLVLRDFCEIQYAISAHEAV